MTVMMMMMMIDTSGVICVPLNLLIIPLLASEISLSLMDSKLLLCIDVQVAIKSIIIHIFLYLKDLHHTIQ